MTGDEVPKKIAVELVAAVQSSAAIDWSLKESVRAAVRSKIRGLSVKYDYPPDYEERAVELILDRPNSLRQLSRMTLHHP